ncbi:MAG: SMC-Scp complex subunit ScpB [Opitutaceae bacterium]|jgi:segregation and condensation protein B|nr:SMC-Scp complex subunit ScpB [Opitutaceae bacterium]
MAFNLKLVLKALLFSSSQPLTIKDIQTVFARYHDQAQTPLASADDAEAAEAPVVETTEVEGAPKRELSPEDGAANTEEETNPLGLAPVDAELYQEVPSLVTAAQIREAMDQLAEELKAANDIYLLIDGAQGYRLVTHPRFAKWIRVQRDEPPPVKLTQSALETLSVVAYRQPVTRSEIESIRGVSCENVLNKLLERDLVYVVGRADLPGRPIQYGTTDKFLEFVGIKSLVELPASDVLSPRQIDEWLNRSTNVTPPADAEMGLPLEEGEGESPSLEPVEIAHVEAAGHEESAAEVLEDATEIAESIEGDWQVEPAAEPSQANDEAGEKPAQ